ncbi:helix-turn-helix domain-containing protein [Streptomyces sp. NPDC002215]|uniref:helix-turn-helix domain-containing protein n=1 Tax=Streptomyces sp. NPDC002215 TaxID=3154412 RepID=UPI00332BBDE3
MLAVALRRRDAKESVTAIAGHLGVGRSTLYRTPRRVRRSRHHWPGIRHLKPHHLRSPFGRQRRTSPTGCPSGS